MKRRCGMRGSMEYKKRPDGSRRRRVRGGCGRQAPDDSLRGGALVGAEGLRKLAGSSCLRIGALLRSLPGTCRPGGGREAGRFEASWFETSWFEAGRFEEEACSRRTGCRPRATRCAAALSSETGAAGVCRLVVPPNRRLAALAARHLPPWRRLGDGMVRGGDVFEADGRQVPCDSLRGGALVGNGGGGGLQARRSSE